jgi:glucose dehydrogenase
MPRSGGRAITTPAADAHFRAFDSRKGKELWSIKLEAIANASRITYLGHDGRQYAAIGTEIRRIAKRIEGWFEPARARVATCSA